jgi:hypothetical protein
VSDDPRAPSGYTVVMERDNGSEQALSEPREPRRPMEEFGIEVSRDEQGGDDEAPEADIERVDPHDVRP